jgi:ubiquinol-cytochrome c reductase iron-sulfur subunit
VSRQHDTSTPATPADQADRADQAGAAAPPRPPGRPPVTAAQAAAARRERERKVERSVTGAFTVSAVASLGLVVVYILGGQTQIEGALLALAFGGLGLGIAIWGERLLDARDMMASEPAERKSLQAALAEEAGPALKRRSFLVRALLGAGAALVAALIPPIASLGPPPGDALKTTAWRPGRRLVNQATGEPLHVDDLVNDQVVTVLPEDDPEAADSVALLIKLDPDLIRLAGEKRAGTVNGLVCYSKICTHAGCPVGLYRARIHSLFCPCHQSQFDVLDDCRPTFGPAARPLPQLPIAADEDGFLYAKRDFLEPVGPAFWDRNKGLES